MTRPVVVITGATGLIGTQLSMELQGNYDVHCVCRRPSSDAPGTRHTFDLSGEAGLDGLPAKTDAVIYLAQSEFFREFPEHSIDVFQVNTVNVLRLLDYARKARCRTFVYASSGGVYGAGDMPMSEDTQIPARGNLGFYLTTKLCSEIMAQNYAQFFDVVVLRFFFVYGPAQRPSMLIPRLIERVRTGQSIALQGEPGIRINPTYVSDAVAATARALELRASHTINVAGPDVLSMRDIGNLIGRAVGREPVFKIDPGSGAGHLVADTRRMRELLVPPKVGFAQGLESMLKAVRSG
jgi:UDP-glucose 4-epimerase